MTEDSEVDFDDHPRSWLDAFPWIKGARDARTGRWWEEEINDAPVADRDGRLAEIAQIATERLTHWTIGQIFPGLSPDLDLRDLRLPARATNAFARKQILTASELMNLSLETIMDWRQVGVGTIDAVLRALADASLSQATPTVATSQPNSERMAIDTLRLPDWLSSLVDDLGQVAGWYITIGLPNQQLLGAPLAAGTPNEIVKARQRLEAIEAADVPADGAADVDVAASLDEVLGTLDRRAVQTLRVRLFANVPRTLDELGHEFDVTRERVRQIEGKARAFVLGFVSEGGLLAMVAESVRTLISSVRPLDELLAAMPALDRTVETVGQPAWRVLDRLDDSYEIQDGWCVIPSMTTAKVTTQTQLQERADVYGVARLEDLEIVKTDCPERGPELAAAWLAHCGYIVEGGHVLTRTQSVGDYGAAVLSIAGSPLTAQDIVDRLAVDRTAGSLRNAMNTDERFERVDRDRWALSEWGMEAYSGIRSIIREQIAHSGGRAKIDDLVEFITGRYSVSASSVAAYAGSLPFQLRDGVVSLASGDHGSRKPPERTHRLFRRSDGWLYRVCITTDHLRGSGFVAPFAIVGLLDLHFGQTRQLESPLGPQAVLWTGTQPSFGTIRRFLMDQDIASGTHAFLVINDDGSFGFEVARELTGDPLADALTLIGAPEKTAEGQARLTLARAIGLPDASPVQSVIAGYRERGDIDIAELLTECRDRMETTMDTKFTTQDADVDDILELL